MDKKVVYNRVHRKENINKCLCKTNNMCTLIKMEYLVANALVELYENRNIDRVSLEDIRNYGIKVEEKLNKENKIKAVLLYSNNYTKEFLHDYSDWFEMVDGFIKIKTGVTIDDIRDHILSYISIDILLALIDENTLSVLDDLQMVG